MDRMALTPQMVACVNAMLAASRQDNGKPGFATDEIVELFESLMLEPGQRVEPVWSHQASEWQWRPTQH